MMTEQSPKPSESENPEPGEPERRRDDRRSGDRRSGRDRRNDDLLTPVKLERRKQVDPRKLDIVEVELTESQWASNFGPHTPKE